MVDSRIMPVSSFRDVVALWRSPAEMAVDVGAGISGARKWKQRDRIPDRWWIPIAASEVARRAGVTVEMLASFSTQQAEERAPSYARARR